MKNKILPSMVGLALFAGNAFALAPVKELFNGTTLSQTRWYQYKQESGLLAPQKGKLNFLTKGAATENDFASIELLNSQPGYNEDWQLILDLANNSKAGKKAACGIMLFNVGDRKDYLFLEFYGKSGIEAGIITDSKHSKKNHISIPVATSKGSLRLTFDKATKLLSLEVSTKSKRQGYEWVAVGTFSPRNGQNGTVRANWNMDAGSGRFGVQLFGFGNKVKIGKGKLTYDNLVISAKS